MLYYTSVKDSDFTKIIEKRGWELDRIVGSHHIYKKGSTTISVPIHKKDLRPGLLCRLLKKAGLTPDDIKKGWKK
jgi:predicted RNA binding protein YcfA (HicA-like mRNA interferase family)